MKFKDRLLEDVRPKHRGKLREAIADYLKLVQQAQGNYDAADILATEAAARKPQD